MFMQKCYLEATKQGECAYINTPVAVTLRPNISNWFLYAHMKPYKHTDTVLIVTEEPIFAFNTSQKPTTSYSTQGGSWSWNPSWTNKQSLGQWGNNRKGYWAKQTPGRKGKDTAEKSWFLTEVKFAHPVNKIIICIYIKRMTEFMSCSHIPATLIWSNTAHFGMVNIR